MSFSVLARCCLGDTMKIMFEHMNTTYKLTRLHSETTDVLRPRPQTKRVLQSRQHNWEVQTVFTFMQEPIRALKFNVFLQFTGPLKNDNPAHIPGSGLRELYTSDQITWIKNVKDRHQADVHLRSCLQ